MGVIKAALGLKLSNEEWRALEGRYGGAEGPTQRVDETKRRFGEYQKSRDQLIYPSAEDERERN